MAKLRDMIDGRLLAAFPAPKGNNQDQDDDGDNQQQFGKPQAGPPQQNGMPGAPAPKAFPSPAGQHVANNIQDPYSATKDELDDLNQAKLAYEMKKAQMQMKLAPVQHVVDGIKQMHEMQDPNQMNPMNPDPTMGYTDPNDPTGGMGNMAGSPQGGAQPGMMPQGAMPQPGLPPGQPKEAIRPLKLGMPQPGQGNPAAIAGNPSQQFNPAAPKPPGAGSMPGANGPGAPGVQNQIKKAQSGSSKKSSGGSKSGGSSSSGKVAIHVHADSISSSPAKRTVNSYAGADSLRMAGGECSACGDKMKAYGTSQGVEKEWQVRRGGSTAPMTKERYDKGRIRYLKDQLKRPGTSNLNIRKSKYGRYAFETEDTLKSYGTSEGVKKEWETRGHGKKEPIVDLNDKRGNLPYSQRVKATGGVFTPNIKSVAPPGREKQVKKLKKKFGTTSAFKIAWSQYKGKK